MKQCILVVGSVNADLYVALDRLPLPGETLPGSDAAVRPGGKGANQAAAAAKLGVSTAFAGRFGDDAFAAPLRAALIEAGVDLSPSRSTAGPSGQAIILLQRGGQNSIVLVGGANRAWEEAHDFDCSGVAALMLQREIPYAVNLRAASAARATGAQVVLDAGGDDEPLPDALLAQIDVLSPNESELARLTGLPTDSDAAVLHAARHLQARGVAEVLVKLGARGCLLLPAAGEPLHQETFPVPVVDTTGAGDCFTAAYTVSLVEGLPPAARLRFACAAATLCVQTLGAMPSMPTRAAVEDFLKRV